VLALLRAMGALTSDLLGGQASAYF
jgi:hypothetical protein